MSKSKLVLSECNDLHFIAIAFIAFTLHEIKQCQVFFGTPGRCYLDLEFKVIVFCIQPYRMWPFFQDTLQEVNEMYKSDEM